jgi:FkbM family methyltransferase
VNPDGSHRLHSVTEPALLPPSLDGYLATPSLAEVELGRLFGRTSRLTIFDVGACEGEDSIRYARRFPRARVFAFEPLPENQALMRENLRRYHAERVELVPSALADRAGTAVFHVSSGRPREEFAGRDWNYGNKSSSLLAPAEPEVPMFGWLEFKRSITVPTQTLDGFCASRQVARIDFIHLDVQGAEALVLAGARAMLPRVTALCLEVSDRELYAGQRLRSEMEAFLRGAGFALIGEERREIEGDQFYVNARRLRSRLRLVRRGLTRIAGAVRSRAARIFSP